MDIERLTTRAATIAAQEKQRLLERTPGSARLYERASKSLPLGVVSNFQAADPIAQRSLVPRSRTREVGE